MMSEHMSNGGFVVEQRIPIPPRNDAKKYPFDHMNVGDSFGFPEADRMRIYASAKKRVGEKYSIRKVDNNSCRIWRVK